MDDICGSVSGANLPPGTGYWVNHVLTFWSTGTRLHITYQRPDMPWTETFALDYPYAVDLFNAQAEE